MRKIKMQFSELFQAKTVHKKRDRFKSSLKFH